MELNSDLIAIQGILISAAKSTGDFSKIQHKGGNEQKIGLVIKELEEYLVSKQYLRKQRKSNKKYQSELENIALFFILNSELKSEALSEIKEFSHLLKIAPALSKCLLANVIVELDLLEYYCVALHKLPFELSEELLSEFVPCVRRIGIKQCLECSYILLLNVIKRIGSEDSSVNKVNEMMKKVEDIALEILLNMSGINPEQLQGWSKLKVYKHMGVTLIKLLNLLQFCQLENPNLQKIIEFLLSTACSVIKAVTVDVFCGWAEVHYREQVLQSVVSSEAYYVVEKYHKHESAQQLIQMLGSFAKKPETLAETIQKADITTIIANVNECNPNQKAWFTALLNCGQVLENDEALSCIRKWYKLCTLEDVTRLLNLGSKSCSKKSEVQKLILKCASHLDESDLTLAISRFFHQHGLRCCLHFALDEAQTELTKILNQLGAGKGDVFRRQILLLLLQDPVAVVTQMFKECIKSRVMLACLKQTIQDLAKIMQIEELSTKTLEKLVRDVMKPNADNINNYGELCQVIMANTFAGSKLVERIIKSYTEGCYEGGHFDELKYALDLYHNIVDRGCAQQYSSLFLIALKILDGCRWKFFDFSFLKASLCEKCVCIALDYIKYIDERQITLVEEVRSATVEHNLNKYYVSRLHKLGSEAFFDYACPSFNPDNHSESVCFLIKLLPICVPQEVTDLCEHLHRNYGYEKLLSLLTDALMLICEVAKTQKQNNDSATNCLKYCVQNFGAVIKNIIAPLKRPEADVQVNKSICRLLREIPPEIKSAEGMSLLGLMTEESLRSSVQDKSFICLVAAIQDAGVSQVIAKKMLS